MSSLSPRAGYDERGARRFESDESDGLTFGSVRHALGFYFERGEAMQHPLGQHPRGEIAPDGSTVIVQVDGGRGGSIDDIHATLQTIRQVMQRLAEDKIAHDLVVLHFRDGLDQVQIGKARGMSRQTVSVHLGRGISFLSGWLRANGIVRGGSWAEDRR